MHIKQIYIGLALTSGLATTLNLSNPTPIAAQTPQEIQKVAREITVRINADANQGGSGVIIAKQGNTYYLATVAHVVASIDSYTAITHDGKSHPINSLTIKKFQNGDVDLAVVSFVSDRNYPVAKISRYLAQTYERRSINNGIFEVAAIANQQQAVFVSGFPNFEDTNASGKTYVFNPGQIIDTSGSAISDPTNRSRGYRLTYSNLTHVGMSGGAILDANARLIGIHGRSDGISKTDTQILERTLDETKRDFRVNFGNSLGIPITTFLELLPDTGLQLDLQAENTAPRTIPLPILDSWMPPILANERVNPVYWINRGNQLWRIGKIKESQDAFDRATQLTDKVIDKGIAWYAKGFVSGFNRDYQEALRSCTRAVELSPKTYDGWRCKAGAEYRTGKPSEALKSIDRAIEINGDPSSKIRQLGLWRENPTDYTERGEILFVLDRKAEAIASFRKAIEIEVDGRIASAWSNMGFVQMKMGDFPAAESSIDRAIAIDAKFAPAWSNRGRLLYERKRYLESVAAYDEASKLNPQDPEIWTNRGAALYFAGNKNQALKSIDQALSIDPNYKPAQEIRSQIGSN
jgi:tetratricopeptide (TPR) repeat protein